MRMSRLYMPTLREVSSEAEIPSHQLLLRAGMVRRITPGIFSYLPLGHRVLRKIENIVREEMDKLGAQELLTSTMQPKELWEISGRWESIGTEMFQFMDRSSKEFCFGYSHEEYLINLIKNEVRSYKQLPLTLYQIQTKYRDEIKPRFGIIKAKEFIMKDAYSFDKNTDDMENSYRNMWKSYENIFNRLKLKFKIAEAGFHTKGHEFIATAETGDESFVYCKACDYAANSKSANVIYNVDEQEDIEKPMERVHTPNVTTIEDLEAFFNMDKSNFGKSLIYVADGKPILVVVPGDRELNEMKLCSYLGISLGKLEMADETIVEEVTHAKKGFAGPVGVKEGVRIIVDSRITRMKNLIVGGNETDYHIMNVNYGRDFKGEIVEDLLLIQNGDICPKCGEPLDIDTGIEIGNISQSGTVYSQQMKATFLDEDGKEKPFLTGKYFLDISRILAAIIEQNNDDSGIVWPLAVAPYHVVITVVKTKDEDQVRLGEYLYEKLQNEDIEVLLDDRNESPGVKFKDRDLIGIPIRITVGKRASENIVEYSLRGDSEKEEISADEVLVRIKEELEREGLNYKG